MSLPSVSWKNPDFYSAPLQNIEQALGGRIREVMNLGDFTGKHKTTNWLYTNGTITAPACAIGRLGGISRSYCREGA